jgi:uncharacterized protein
MPNRLAQETSPYLQQHADNPVDWYPWGEEALTLARKEDKPILLSIGYSACHWCHVMAHESFEDPEVADEMNRHYVNIKVDREERPDLDQIYQTAHHLLTQRSGGWPLTMVLTPDGAPFFAGTYFPKAPRYGMPGFRALLSQIAEAYRTRRGDIAQQNASLMQALASTVAPPADDVKLTAAPINAALRALAQSFDDVHGGIGRAPKFPHPYELAYCLRRHTLDGGELPALIARRTLRRMAEGGIYDHLAGGFCRYSTDQFWTIPHFEKMLYDNGPLLALYSDAWRATREPLFETVVRDTAAWVMRDMQSPEGGYYSSLDADSEGEEGRFYVWTPDEVRALLSADEYVVVAPHYGIDREPNFEGMYWHLRVTTPLADVAQQQSVSHETCRERLASARATLLAAREQRIHPGRDDKILASWNALMIRGMVRAYQAFGEKSWLRSARRAMDFIRAALWQNGRLLATYKDGRAHLNAYLDDHAFLLDASIELMQAEFRADDLKFARAIAELLLSRFEDDENGGFYFVSHDHETLIHRPRTGHDNATPSGNGIAAYALQRLGHLIGETRYITAAERVIRAFHEAIERAPSAHVSLITALDEALNPPAIVVIRGAADEAAAWRQRLASSFRPDTLVVAVPDTIKGLPETLAKPTTEAMSAWICAGTRCLPPIPSIDELELTLAARHAHS